MAFRYIFKLMSNDSVLVNSATASQDGSGVTKFIMPKSSFQGSLEDAMMMMAVNDSASFIVSADSFYLKTQRAPQLPPFLKKLVLISMIPPLKVIFPSFVKGADTMGRSTFSLIKTCAFS